MTQRMTRRQPIWSDADSWEDLWSTKDVQGEQNNGRRGNVGGRWLAKWSEIDSISEFVLINTCWPPRATKNLHILTLIKPLIKATPVSPCSLWILGNRKWWTALFCSCPKWIDSGPGHYIDSVSVYLWITNLWDNRYCLNYVLLISTW